VPLALPALAIGFSVLVTFIAFWAMHQGSNTWLRTLLEEYTKPRGSFVKRAVTAPARYVLKGVLRVERVVRAALAAWLVANTLAVAAWIANLAVLALGVAHEVRDLGLGIEAGIGRLVHVWIPRELRKALSPVDRLAHAGLRAGHQARAYAEAQAARLRRGIDTLRRDLRREIARARKGIEAGIAAHVIPRIRGVERSVGRILSRDLPRIRARERALEHAFEVPDKAWLRRIGQAIWAASIFGLLVKFLVRRFPWLFCRNVDRLARRVCGLDADALAAVEALLLGSLVLQDYRTLVRLMQDVERDAIDEVERLLSVF
jgi:hypothetical protein